MTKKRDLERELMRAGWEPIKSSGGHDKFRKGNCSVMVPRHREIKDEMAAKIRREAGLR